MSFRTYHDVTGPDASRLGEQVARQRARVAERLGAVGRVVVVFGGKGGVGKSHVAAALAVAVARRALAVGVVDADLHAPTVARLLGAASRAPLAVHDDGVTPAVGRDGIRVMSADFLLAEDRPLRWAADPGFAHAWRGAAETAMLREFVADVRWGALAALVVDTPPDAGRLADLAALLSRVDAAIAVTIPTEESRRAVSRALDAARAAGIAVTGVVENMSGYACGRCGAVGPLFPGDAGARLAADHGVPLLARLPFTAAPLDETATRLDPIADRVLGATR